MKKSIPLYAAALALNFIGAGAFAQEKGKEMANDWLLIPERRAGPITKEWTGIDLLRAFGTLHCKGDDIPVGEGETMPGFRIYPGTDDELEVLLDPETGKVQSVNVQLRFDVIKDSAGEFVGSRLVPRKTRWRSVSGITLSSTVPEVEAVNGRPFEIQGWETDYSGAVTSWKKGKIPDSFYLRFMYSDQKAYDAFWQKIGEGGNKFDGMSNGAMIAAFKPTVYHFRIDL